MNPNLSSTRPIAGVGDGGRNPSAGRFRSLRTTAYALLLACPPIGLHPGAVRVAEATVLALTDADRLCIETSLGRGVLGPAIAAPVIDEPARFFTLAPTTKLFTIVHGARAGATQPYRVFPAPDPTGRPGWRYRSGDDEVGFLERLGNGSLVISGVEDIQTRALTRYDPPEPFLPKGLVPGERRRVRMSVNVYPSGGSTEVIHRGELTVDYHYLGAYRLALPAGNFEAVVIKSTFHGRIGPASLEDTQYRFFAPGTGLLAAIENRHVSAFWIYQSDMEVAKVLARDSP